MKVPALYYPHGDPDEEPKFFYIREHYSIAPAGSLSGWSGAAEMQDFDPRLIIDVRDMIDPDRDSVFALRPNIAYAVESVEPPDGLFQKVYVSRLATAQAGSYKNPETQFDHPDDDRYTHRDSYGVF